MVRCPVPGKNTGPQKKFGHDQHKAYIESVRNEKIGSDGIY